MNEQLLTQIYSQAPTLAFAIWMVFQMKSTIDKLADRIEGTARLMATSLDKSTEMLGRGIQSSGQTEALHSRALDIIQAHTDELRRGK